MSCPKNYPNSENRNVPYSWAVKIFIGLVVFIGLLGCNLASTIRERSNPATPAAATPTDAPGETPAAAPDNPEAAVPPDEAVEPTGIPTAAPEALGDITLEPQSAAAIPASGEWVDSETGVAVSLPPDALDDVEAQLSQFEIDPGWRAALEQQYVIESPFVSVTTTGLNDSRGRASVRLPAPSPNSQLVALIDMSYLAVVNVEPVDGYLETAVRVGTSEESGESLAAGGELHFVVLTPNNESSSINKSGLGKPNNQADGRSCGADISYYTGRVNAFCRQTSDGTVQVTFSSDIGLSQGEGDVAADAMAAAINQYAQMGFSAASLSAWSPMRVVVQAGSGDPLYRSGNGVIYLPLDAAQNLSGGANHEILHEMAHWIQDEEYNMTWAYWAGGRWWLEVAAENMVMLQDPAYIPQNLETYGAIATDDNRLALQQAINQWPSDFYAHAQLVKLNMCNDTAVCPLSEKTFVAAINAGSYPYDDAGAQAKLNGNLDAYAQYLLGVSPTRANTAMPLTGPVASGDRYSEYVNIAKTNNSDYRLSFNGYPPQMEQVNDDRGSGVNIQATLQKNGVYPLLVSSGIADGRSPGAPAALIIQPGAPFWYRIGSDTPLFHDGSEELILQPIHSSMGIPAVRIAAMGKNGGELFQAQIRPIDLQGVWLFSPGSLVSSDIQCISDDAESSGIDEPENLSLLVTLGSMLGRFQTDAAGLGLTWKAKTSQWPSELGEAGVAFEGAVLPGADDVKVQAAFHWPQPSQSKTPAGWPPLAIVAMVGIGPGLLVWRNGRRRPYLIFFALLIVGVTLTGCFGFDLWGDINADLQFTELEYIGGESVPVFDVNNSIETDAEPLWKAQGTGEYDVDFSFEVVGTTIDDSGNEIETRSLTHCAGTAVYQVEALIFKDVIVNFNE